MDLAGHAMTGFDYLRIILAVAVLGWHGIGLSGNPNDIIWAGAFRFLPAFVLPMFFALSGFLVSGSLERNNLHHFMLLRALRLVPALAVETALCAFILGLAFTNLPWSEYLTNREFYHYFANIIGRIHYFLPGVFETNTYPRFVNGQLWTIPFELECYATLVLLALATILKRRVLFCVVVAAASIGFTIWVLNGHPVDPESHVPGRVLVLSFLAAVAVYLFRDFIPYSNVLGIASAAIAGLCLQIPDASYLASFPVAYMTVWLGMKSPPKIPFGDLSYGVYLFHFPVQQSVVYLFPAVHSWWSLTLISLPLTALFAWFSWTFVEEPILSRKKSILRASDKAISFGAWLNPTGLLPFNARSRSRSRKKF